VADDPGSDGLFEVDPRERIDRHSSVPKPSVDKTFRVFDPEQGLLLPPSLDDWLWLLLTACHNLRKLHGLVGVNGRADLAITRPGHHLTCPPQALVRSSVHPRHRVCTQGDDTLNTLTLTAE